MIDLRTIAPRPYWPIVDDPSDYFECERCEKPFAEHEDSQREGEVIQHEFVWARCKDCAWIPGDM